jgi:hypothetical protein
MGFKIMTNKAIKDIVISAKNGRVMEIHEAFDKAVRERLIVMIQARQKEIAKTLFADIKS